MNKMTGNQRGITFIGICFVLGIIAGVVMIALRLFPLYNEKLNVIAAMNSVANRPDAAELSTTDVRKYFLRSIEVGDPTTRFNDKTVKKLAKVVKGAKGGPRLLTVEFEARNIFFDNIYFLMDFKHSTELRGNKGGG